MVEQANETLYDGVRIVEIGHSLTEHAGRIMAALGAEVWLIEPPGGAVIRHRNPRVPDVGDSCRGSLAFLARNPGKRSVVIDPDNPDDVLLLHGLIARSDVVIDAEPSLHHEVVMSAPGDASRVTVTDRLGLGYSGMVSFAAGGGMASSGWPHQAPCGPPGNLSLDAAGIYAATAVAAATWIRHRYGARADYEVDYEYAVTATTTPWTRVLHSAGTQIAGQGAVTERLGAGSYPILPTKDGSYVRCVMATPRHWDGLVAMLGYPEDLVEGPWVDVSFRRENHDAFQMILGELSKQFTADELFRHGQAAGLPVTPVYSPGEFRRDAHVKARNMFVEVNDPEFGTLEMLRPPFLSDPDGLVNQMHPAPALDAARDDLEAVLREAPRPSALPSPAEFDPRRPFAGIRILQLGSGAVVPEGCSVWAMLGAEVIRVESRVYPDFMRRSGLASGNIDDAPGFNQLNLGVKSLAVDMNTDEGRGLVSQLVTECDLVVENMRGSVVTGWGLGYDRLRAIRSDIIGFSSQGLGIGPYGHFQTFGPNLAACSGVTWLWSHEDDPFPAGTTLPHPDHAAGKQAFVAFIGALMRRDRTGEGCFLESAQVEGAAWHISEHYLEDALLGRLTPQGNTSRDFSPHGCYPCQDDRWLALCVETDEQWQALRQKLDIEVAGADSIAQRLQARVDIDRVIASRTSDMDIADAELMIAALGIPCSRVVTGDELAANEAAHVSGFFGALDHPGIGERTYTGMPLVSVSTGRPPVLHPPKLGEHTDEVLSGLMDLDAETISDLRDRQIVGY